MPSRNQTTKRWSHEGPAWIRRMKRLSSNHMSLLAQPFSPVLRGAGSADLAEYPCKMLLGFKAAGDGNIQDTRLGSAQHLFGTFYPMSQDKLMRALTRGLAKHLREMSRAQPHCFRHFVET